MKKKKFVNLPTAMENAKKMLIESMTEFVRKNGEEMSDYYYNEFGMDEEDEEGVKIVKVYDTSDQGCCFARQFKTDDDTLENIGRDDEGFEIFDKLENSFHYATYWALYIVREADGTENLKYYCFYNDGVCYQEDSEPDHNYVFWLTLEDIVLIMNSLSKQV